MYRVVFLIYTSVLVCSSADIADGVSNCEGGNQLSLLSGCVCPGYIVSYSCSINGGGNTVWNGTAFNCPSSTESSNNQILLRHSQFSSGSGGNTIRRCNNDDIVGMDVGVEGTCYTSQLNVIVNSDVIDDGIACYHDNGSSEILIGNATIMVTSGDELYSPSNVSLIKAVPDLLGFSWTPVVHNCSVVQYNVISTSECGNCPTTVNTTSANCSISRVQPEDNLMCTFSVQALVCDSIMGKESDPANVRLKVPDAPLISGIPTYSQQNKSLLRITISFTEMASISISNEVSGSPSSYSVTFFNTTFSNSCDSHFITSPSCKNGLCLKEFDATSLSCFSSFQLSFTVFAINVFGNGAVSNRISIDETNQLVDIEYDTSTSILCKFLNQQDMNDVSCSIEYKECQHTETTQLNATSSNMPNTLQITLLFDRSDQAKYCYIVTASNSTLIVYVQGTLIHGSSPSDVDAVIGGVLGAIGGIAVVVAVIIIVVGIACWKYRRTDYKQVQEQFELKGLVSIDCKHFKVYPVEKKCELSTLIADLNLEYMIGCVYYEFAREEEDILEDKKENGVILMDQSPLLYDESTDSSDVWIPVDRNRFKKLSVKRPCPLIDFIEEDCRLLFEEECAFCEFSNDIEDIGDDKEVILMDKKTEVFFTGTGPKRTIGAPGKGIQRPKQDEWYKAFIQSKYVGARHLNGNTLVLYEEPDPEKQFTKVAQNRFTVLDVNEHCQLYEFIVNKNLKFDAGRIFFEFTMNKEEITSDKEVIIMEKDTGKLFTGPNVKRKVGAPCPPGEKVNRPHLKNYCIFIQSAGSGTRSLRPGTHVLYEN